MSLSLKEISSAINGRIEASYEQRVITHLTTDSREVCKGDLFIALKGDKYDGENYLHDVIAKGAIPITTSSTANAITVKNTQDALFLLAKHYKSLLKDLKHTVAITGSVGKTTTKEFANLLLECHYKTHASSGNFNNKIGLPLSILSATENTELLILEMGMNHKGEISELSKCATPTIAVITNIGSAHIGNLGSKENIVGAKLEILDGMKEEKLILPYGEPLLSHLKNTVSFSTKSSRSDVYIIYNEGNCIFGDGIHEAEVNLGSFPPHLLECVAAAVAICLELGLTINDIKRHFSLISDKNLRQTKILTGNFTILADYYNASPESVIAALEFLASHKQHEHRSALLGDILELGKMSEEAHFTIGRKCAECNLRTLYLFGEYSDFTEEGAISGGMDRERIFKNTRLNCPEITANQISKNVTKNEIILFKASHAVKLGRIVSLLKSMSGKE